PLVYVPGDNEWTDCGTARAGRFDPGERLEWLRTRHFARASFPTLERQSDRNAGAPPENRRWWRDGVRFVTLNLPGSNNGLDADGLQFADWQRREAFNRAWLLETFRVAAAADDTAIVVVAHANPRFGIRPGWQASSL